MSSGRYHRFFRKLRKHQVEMKDALPLAIFNLDAVSGHIIANGFFDRKALESLVVQLEVEGICVRKKIFLDIGANIGNHSVFLADYFDSVVAFEPHPRTFKLLQANAFLKSNIVCKNMALGSVKTKMHISTNFQNMGRNRVTTTANLNSFEIDVVRIDDVIKEFRQSEIGLVKIDVEGFEVEVLRGGEEFFKKFSPPTILEILPDEIFDGTSQGLELLRSFGYNKFSIFEELPNKTTLVSALSSPFASLRDRTSGFYPIGSKLPNKEIPMLLALKV